MVWSRNLYIPGLPACSNLEKAADFSLKFSSSLWEGKNVKITHNQEFHYTNQGQIEAVFSEATAFTKGFINPNEYGIGVPMYLGVKLAKTVVSVVALPSDLLGKGLKFSALAVDSQAKHYNNLAKDQLSLLKNIENEKQALAALKSILDQSALPIDTQKALYSFLLNATENKPDEMFITSLTIFKDEEFKILIRPMKSGGEIYDYRFEVPSHYILKRLSMPMQTLEKYISEYGEIAHQIATKEEHIANLQNTAAAFEPNVRNLINNEI